jgi:large conductance mechanosensitive channel
LAGLLNASPAISLAGTAKRERAVFSEFKKFAMRGNVVDLAVGVVIGAAFSAIVNSLVKDVITPPIGWVTGGIDFSNFFFVLKGGTFATLADAQKAGAITINYGVFLNAIISFLIIAFILFLIMRQINKLTAPPPSDAPIPPPEDIALLREIRDLLKART